MGMGYFNRFVRAFLRFPYSFLSTTSPSIHYCRPLTIFLLLFVLRQLHLSSLFLLYTFRVPASILLFFLSTPLRQAFAIAIAFTRGYITIPFSVLFIKQIVPNDQDHGWTDAKQDETGYVAICLRYTKSIAIGRICNAPAHRACDSCSSNNKPGCNSVGRVSTSLLAGDSPC